LISQRVSYLINYFKMALLNIKSNIAGNFFAFAIMSFSYFIMLFFLLCYANIYNYMRLFQKNNIMIVFLKNGVKKDNVINYIKTINGVKTVHYYSHKSSLKFLERKVSHIRSVLKNINPDFLPSFIKIRFKKDTISKIFLSNIYLRIKTFKGVSIVYYNKLLEDKIIQFMFFTKVIGLIIFLFLFILSIFISYSAIKLVILRKQSEIEILKLIGATNNYIRIPMFIEGEIGTILSFCLSILLLFVIFKIFLYYHFSDFLAYFHIGIIFLSGWQIFLIFIIALVSGFFGTYLSSKKFFYESKI